MPDIKTILAGLSHVEREQLTYALETETATMIEYTPGRFIGVYTESLPSAKITQSAGFYQEGEILDVHAESNRDSDVPAD